MPIEDWIQHCIVARFLYDWQTLVAGVLAVLAAAGTIWATIKSADREISASQAQTAVAQKQIETTVRLERERVLSEDKAFRAMLDAAVVRVFAEAAWARKAYPGAFEQTTGSSVEAYAVRNNCITKSAFAELRAACVRQRSPLTFEFLDLEREIDNFAMRWRVEMVNSTVPRREGMHAGLREQLGLIEKMATALHQKAAEK